MKRTILSLASLLVAIPSLCLASGTGLDSNDVSFLFPLRNGDFNPAISLEADELIPRRHFESVLRFENPTAEIAALPYVDIRFMREMKSWAVTSMRIDPCGEVFSLEPLKEEGTASPVLLASQAPGCQARLRLVVQPMNMAAQPLATAIHLLYSLSEAQLRDMAGFLAELKSKAEKKGHSTTGLPLMTHPTLQAEAAAGTTEFGDLLKAKIRMLVSSSPLEIVTLSARVAVNHWRFVGGYIHEGKWTRFVTDFSKQFYLTSSEKASMGVEDLDCDQNSICRIAPSSLPERLAPAGTVLNGIFNGGGAHEQVPGQRSEGLKEKAEIIDSPARTHFFNTNCISCHESSNLRDREKLYLTPALPQGVTPFVARRFLSDKTNGVVNFGYFGTTARISARTAEDSVAAAGKLNELLDLKGPADTIWDLPGFWKCLMGSNDYRSCLPKEKK